MPRLTLIGEKPGPSTDARRPLYPHTTTGAAANLIRLLGWTTEQYLERTDRFNAQDPYIVKPRMGTSIIEQARNYVGHVMLEQRAKHGDCRFLFLGRTAALALPTHELQRMPWGRIADDVMIIPHPSGKNRYYNDPADTEYVRHMLLIFTAGCR